MWAIVRLALPGDTAAIHGSLWGCRSDLGPGSTGQASEVERLQRELAALKESRAADINEDNIRLIGQLTEVSVRPGPCLWSGCWGLLCVLD